MAKKKSWHISFKYMNAKSIKWQVLEKNSIFLIKKKFNKKLKTNEAFFDFFYFPNENLVIVVN